ncbi:tetratricopeptide repeat protein [Flavobacterium sp. GSP27]|uniref:Tetratricopeptide repeat protein n=1 Tax=Flavobacterium bomense TaxID=2497483 RepID=A0A3S0PIG2_9FLAO|nr:MULTISPECIES: tetratricopeptide repeat protein [Flavobacterium]RTY94768.1 tetratricopeptide repeat protein [Flavobacterium sp. GSN2]RTY67691.1 tetratricopeptide repeat protein [Flavobacterium sp. LB2P53]RTY73457.1 tetratricopeptide repeat protein [Flavobacterium sp. LS1R10]RTY81570.1 tetratricopeptide repeat protein [Flavobacterium sp. ZB4P23]RTY81749.1 tetratricopeptide repeat protein [Flavobacterium sp. LS1P28]
MKSKYVVLASALVISVATFAQKDQIKAAEKALKGGKSQEAVTILMEAESLIANAKEAEKAQFFFVKGKALLDLANKKVDADANLSLAAKAYQDLIDAEKVSGKLKFSTEAAASITEIKYKLINAAIADSKINKHSNSAKKLYDAYLLDKKDTINLYYAASTYVNAAEYDTALKLYDDLKNLNYSGKGTSFFAVNKITNEEDLFTTAPERDRVVKIGTHEKPRTEAIPSKRGEIYKNIALILVQNGKIEEAKKAISDARQANPEDTSLVLTEANLYLETKDFEMYKKLIAQVLEKNPNDADLVFNLGVLSANAKNQVDAEKYYLKVIEINPKYINAYINLAAMKLEDEKVIIDEMNKLGTSTKDMKRYDELKKKRENLFKATIPFLAKAVELDPKNEDVSKTLLGVYSALEMTAEYKALKAKN